MARRLNILIVEDEFISRTLLKEMLGPFLTKPVNRRRLEEQLRTLCLIGQGC